MAIIKPLLISKVSKLFARILRMLIQGCPAWVLTWKLLNTSLSGPERHSYICILLLPSRELKPLVPGQINSVDECLKGGAQAKQACHLKDFLFISIKHQELHEKLIRIQSPDKIIIAAEGRCLSLGNIWKELSSWSKSSHSGLWRAAESLGKQYDPEGKLWINQK